MAGTITTQKTAFHASNKGHQLIVDWLCDASGDADAEIGDVTGFIRSIETIPGQNGDLTTDLPTALYDAVLNDGYSVDMANGELVDRSGTVGEIINAAVDLYVSATLTLVVSNAGNAKRGRVILFITEQR